MNKKKIKVLVVCGGVSTERDVSLRSGRAVASALVRAGFSETQLFDLTENNISEIGVLKPDIAFLALHGKGGEDGSIQGYLEQVGIRFTGSNIAASAICMDKILTKRFLKSINIPTPEFIVIDKDDYENSQITSEMIVKKLKLPLVLKAPNQGSSIGVEIVYNIDELEEKLIEVFQYGNKVLAEQFVKGTEVTLPIIGNEQPQTLPIVEITSENQFYDYEAKYTKGMCHHIIPAKINKNTENNIKKIGIKAYREIGCEGISRIDFIINPLEVPMVIEINTLPGMTEMSLVPDSARYAGISFEALVGKIVELAISKK